MTKYRLSYVAKTIMNIFRLVKKRRSDVYYDVDLDDDLEMHTTAYSTEETTTAAPKKLILKSNKKSPKSECIAPTPIDWTSEITPKYQMNPEKFLIPALIWGPMNQGNITLRKQKFYDGR